MATHLTDEMKSFLQDRRFAVLATINRDGTPQQSTMWYDLDDDEILMNTKRGRLKERNLRRDPRASLCIEDELRWLTIRGTATLIDDRQIAQSDIRHLATRYDGPESAEQEMQQQFSREDRVTIRLPIERIAAYGFP